MKGYSPCCFTEEGEGEKGEQVQEDWGGEGLAWPISNFYTRNTFHGEEKEREKGVRRGLGGEKGRGREPQWTERGRAGRKKVGGGINSFDLGRGKGKKKGQNHIYH